MYFEEFDGDYPICGHTTVVVKSATSSFDTRDYTIEMKWINFDNKIGVSGKRMMEAAKWCDENLKGDWLVGNLTNAFELDDDAMIFKLRWI